MIYRIQRFSDSSSRPNILDLKQVERKLYESGLSKREVDIILDGLRGCDDPEEIMKWVKTGEVNNPEVQKIMEETSLSFPAAYIESKEKLYSIVKDYKRNLDWYKSDLSKNQNKEIIEELKKQNPEKEVDSWNTHHKISEAGRKYQVKKLKKSIKKDIKRATLENEHPKLAALKSTLFSDPKVTNNPFNRFKRAYQEQKEYLQDEGNKKSIKEEISRYKKGNEPEEIKKSYLKYHPGMDLESKEAKKSMKKMKKAGDWIIKQGESNLNHPKREALKYATKNWRSY